MNRIEQFGTTPDPHKRPCKHMQFHADVNVERIQSDGRDNTEFRAGLQVRCVECGSVFHFGQGQPKVFIQIFPGE